jgi:hypothetical protein
MGCSIVPDSCRSTGTEQKAEARGNNVAHIACSARQWTVLASGASTSLVISVANDATSPSEWNNASTVQSSQRCILDACALSERVVMLAVP